MEPLIGQAPQAAAKDVIKDSSARTFSQDVIVASREVPVIVDFWAPWCGPCKQLGPLLEKVVQQAGGKVKLVKVNIDENPQIAQQLRIQSIPAVFAFVKGQPVDGFVGALPESQIRQFVQRLTGDSGPSEIDQAIEMAKQALAEGQLDRAVGIFGQILRIEPQNGKALAGLAQAYVKNGDLKQARQTLEMVGPDYRNDAEVASARAALDLAEQAGAKAGETAALRAKVAQDPGDMQARLDLAVALAASGGREEAVELLLDMVQRNRAWNDEAARKQLVKLFEAFGPTDPLTVSSRRRLSSILFS
jgi:putative thioredoxin